ncbi:DUF411 domain-containing protein [Roseovarius faecimaris]|uniref:DUF411 domain-containing protein n=1 Tax=Roseovarius faecimaris TaxID=2494550 RepID=A0A6I6J1U7_9RHOB|nr:DUF411 domain-containing protein [Roseovarius faecimaris]QGX98728.1 DUF411 domain-containing protein [Roseovarius faecimaris]
MPSFTRRSFLAAALTAPILVRAAHAEEPQIKVYKSPTCGCCAAWVEHLEQDGFNVQAEDVSQDMLWQIKARAGITDDLSSCHTAFVEGYVIEGHVPAQDIRRLLAERPEGLGLSVPGMPIGSPGMEMGDEREPYATLLVHPGGAADFFARHN